MNMHILSNAREMGAAAGADAARLIRAAIEEHGGASIVLATGKSQFSVLETLTGSEGIDWARVTMFHLDEYIGLPDAHPASFRKYLQERFVNRVQNLGVAVFVNGETPDPQAECDRLGELIGRHPVDVALVGIGENGHLAFNDPPADFETEKPFIVVALDEACRRQQLGEGWFPTLADVPSKAISMSIRQIMKSTAILCSVPDARKAAAVRDTLEGPVSPACPASILRTHPQCDLYLDRAAASLLSEHGPTYD